MASKISIYKKSSQPIASREYLNVVKDVKKRQSEIQIKLNDAENLKTQLRRARCGYSSDQRQSARKIWRSIAPFEQKI